MTYNINLPLGTNGTALPITVPSGAIKTDYSLKLVGRGAPGYGAAFAENTLKGLTNFASAASDAPGKAGGANQTATPLIGQLWYNNTAKQLMYFVGVGTAGANADGWASLAGSSVTGTTTASSMNVTGDLTVGGTFTMNGAMHYSVQTVSAAGTAQSTAAALTGTLCVVNGATASNGVRLPTPVAGRVVIVCNTHATNALRVYPSSGTKIEDNANDAYVSPGPKARLKFVAVSATQWFMMTAIYD